MPLFICLLVSGWTLGFFPLFITDNIYSIMIILPFGLSIHLLIDISVLVSFSLSGAITNKNAVDTHV
jgi:hypothetical protein